MAGKEMVPAAMARPEWLPEGWSVEYRKRKLSNTVDKYYICPLSGKKLRSRPEVVRFLSSEIPDRPASRSLPLNGHYKPLVLLDHNPSNLPDGWIVETRLRRNSTRRDSYYIDPLTGYKFRSKKGVFRYLDNQKVSRIPYIEKKIHTPDAYSLEEESKKIHPPDAYSLKEESLPLIEFIKSKVKRTVARRRLFPKDGSIPNASTEIKVVEPPKKQVLSLGDASAQLDVDSKPSCSTPAIAEHLEPRMNNFQIECQDKLAVREDSTQQKLEIKMPPEPANEKLSQGVSIQLETNSVSLPDASLIDTKQLEQPKKQRQKRKAEIENVVPLQNSKRLAGIIDDPDADFKNGEMSRREKMRKIVQEYKQDVSITDELGEKLQNLKLFVEHASNEKHVDQKDTPEADELREKLARLDLFAEQDPKREPIGPIATPPFGDSWPDPCIEFAFRTLTGDIFEDITAVQHSVNHQPVSTPGSK